MTIVFAIDHVKERLQFCAEFAQEMANEAERNSKRNRFEYWTGKVDAYTHALAIVEEENA